MTAAMFRLLSGDVRLTRRAPGLTRAAWYGPSDTRFFRWSVRELRRATSTPRTAATSAAAPATAATARVPMPRRAAVIGTTSAGAPDAIGARPPAALPPTRGW